MTSIDELFKTAGVPSKRKLEPVRDPNEIYKSARRSPHGNGLSRHARVEDGGDDGIEAGPSLPHDGDDGGDDDGDYGPAPPPPDDAEAEGDDGGDDDEGRFFGGGITKAEASILDYVEGQGQDGAGASSGGRAAAAGDAAAAVPADEALDAAWLRRTALNFEKRINRNAELRARYETEPTRFIASEADLDADIRALSILGEHPALYPELARLGTAASLVGLLAHDNTDIALSAIEILGELTDEDVDATDDQWVALVDALLDADLVGLLVSNLDRLNEGGTDGPDAAAADAAADDVDRTGVYHALAIVENLCSLRATRAADALGRHEPLLRWLLQRVQRREVDAAGAPTVSQNRQYAAEILAILAQASPANARRLAALDAVDTLLQLAAAYRLRDPVKGGYEAEFMENLFEALTYLVDDPDEPVAADDDDDAVTRDSAPSASAGKAPFVDAEGVELCLLMLKEGHKSRAPALRLLDHAASGRRAVDVCRRVVDAGGLKTLFTLFMKGADGHVKKHKGKHKLDKLDDHTADALVAIVASMLRLLPADSAERIRLLAKFVEKDYEKVRRLLALRRAYAARVAAVDVHMDAEGRGPAYVATLAGRDDDDDAADERDAVATERLSRQLDAGLATRQTLDIVLAWLVAEDTGARATVRALLPERDGDDANKDDKDDPFAVLRQSLAERRDELDTGLAEGKAMREMLSALLECLQ